MSQSGALLVWPLGIFIHVFMHPSTFSTCLSTLAIHPSFTNYQVPIAAETSWVFPRNTWPRRHPGGTLVRCPRHLLPFDVDWFSLRSSHMTELHLICVTARVNCDVNAPDNCCLLLNNKTNKLNLLCWNANRFLLLIWQQSKQRHTDSSSLSPWCQYSNDLYWLKWMEVSFPDFKAVLPHEIHSLASPLQLFEVKDAR